MTSTNIIWVICVQSFRLTWPLHHVKAAPGEIKLSHIGRGSLQRINIIYTVSTLAEGEDEFTNKTSNKCHHLGHHFSNITFSSGIGSVGRAVASDTRTRSYKHFTA